MSAARKRTKASQREMLRRELMDGVEGAPLYDAWGGQGHWIPKVKLTERDASIVTDWAMKHGAGS